MHCNLSRAWDGVSQYAGCVASAAMAAPKKGGFRLVSDYRAVSKQINDTGCRAEPRGGDGRLAGGDMFWEA